MARYIIALMGAILLFIGCGKDSPTNPPAGQGTLLLSRLIVSLVPGGSEQVNISAADAGGVYDPCTITNSRSDIATAVVSDSTLFITAVDLGTTNITVKSGSGVSRTLPVHVYSPYILETADLYITLVDAYSSVRWNDLGSGGQYDGSFYHPITTDGFNAISSLACGPDGYPNPNGTFWMMVVKAKPGHEDALAYPISYQEIYHDVGSGADMFGSFWRPIPPAGYVALGTVVANNTWNAPSLTDVVCVRSDLTTIADCGRFIYNDHETGAYEYLSCWGINQPNAGPHDLAYLATGAFVAVNNWNQPSADPVMNVLKLDLPTLAEAPYQIFSPKLIGFDSPPTETTPIMGKAMLVPCTIINDGIYGGNVSWQVANSPMYRLERHVYYKLLYHNYNQTSEVQTNSFTTRSGITTTESERIWNETSISLSVEAGVSFKAFSGSITATVSHTFGYETQTSVAELMEKEISSSINTPPGKAAALWQQYNKYILFRHNGIQFEPVSSWEFGIDSYVTDEYPD